MVRRAATERPSNLAKYLFFSLGIFIRILAFGKNRIEICCRIPESAISAHVAVAVLYGRLALFDKLRVTISTSSANDN